MYVLNSVPKNFSCNAYVLAALQITVNPHDVMGLIGESVSLCCQASGNPSASYYEWYVDVILDGGIRGPRD